MGATNTTANYSLSQFIGTDKPAWLQDYNGDMLKIDTGINAAKVAADGAQNSASAAQNDATTANNAITNTINPAINSLNTTVGNQGGAINTINSLIGNGTPTTTDQTIIGAINEIVKYIFFVDPTKYHAISSPINANDEYEAPADGVYFFSLKKSSGSTQSAMIYSDSNRSCVLLQSQLSDALYETFSIPLKAGQKIYTRSTGDYIAAYYYKV